jgi:uncharacterized membrane protein
MKKLSGAAGLHRAFEIGLMLKAFFAALEALGGIVAFLIPQSFILRLIVRLTQQGRIASSDNAIVTFLLHSAQNFSISTRHFVGIYLLIHGIIKLLVLAGLWREKSWAYPLAMIVFLLFILYQLYRFTLTHSPWLMLLTVFDLAVLWLIWNEYRARRAPPGVRLPAQRPS